MASESKVFAKDLSYRDVGKVIAFETDFVVGYDAMSGTNVRENVSVGGVLEEIVRYEKNVDLILSTETKWTLKLDDHVKLLER